MASAAFFRAPTRVSPQGAGLVVAPADGVVALIEDAAPPSELGLGVAPRTRVSIFLSVLDVHVQRIPMAGTVIQLAYHPGAFLSADLDKASEDNERNSVVILDPAAGTEIVVTQIAGLLARRIVCDAAPGSRGVGRRDVRPDPLRLPGGHVPAGRHRTRGAARPAHHRRRDDPRRTGGRGIRGSMTA